MHSFGNPIDDSSINSGEIKLKVTAVVSLLETIKEHSAC